MKDSEIIGCSDVTIDSKGRLTLPKVIDADVKVNDEVVVILNEGIIEIRTSESILNEMKEIREIIKNASTIEIIEYWNEKFEKLCLTVKKKTAVDKQGRILLGEKLTKEFPFKDVVVVGFYDSFRVYPVSLYNEKRIQSR